MRFVSTLARQKRLSLQFHARVDGELRRIRAAEEGCLPGKREQVWTELRITYIYRGPPFNQEQHKSRQILLTVCCWSALASCVFCLAPLLGAKKILLTNWPSQSWCQFLFVVSLVQGWTKKTFPGFVNMGWNNCNNCQVFHSAWGWLSERKKCQQTHPIWECLFSEALYWPLMKMET